MENYDKIKKLGQGSFGAVFLVKDKRDGMLYVMKEIDITSMSSKEKKNALREVGFLAKLSHPAIVGYREWFERVVQGFHNSTKRSLHIVMEYADAGDLSTLLKAQRRGRLSEELVVHYMVQIILALKHMHDRKILHRDIKSENVFLTRTNQVKIGDFGISKHLENSQIARTRIGTPYYLSPEICLDRGYDAKTDMWALGVIIYQMCALRHPFDATSMEGLLHAIIHTRHRPLPTTYSKPLRDLVDALLAKNPKKRPSVYEVLRIPFVNQHISRYLSDPKLGSDLVSRLMESLAYRAGSSTTSTTSGSTSTSASNTTASPSLLPSSQDNPDYGSSPRGPPNISLASPRDASSYSAVGGESKDSHDHYVPHYGEVPKTVHEETEEDVVREAKRDVVGMPRIGESNEAEDEDEEAALRQLQRYRQLQVQQQQQQQHKRYESNEHYQASAQAPVSQVQSSGVSRQPVSSRVVPGSARRSPYPGYVSPARGQPSPQPPQPYTRGSSDSTTSSNANPSYVYSPVRPVPMRSSVSGVGRALQGSVHPASPAPSPYIAESSTPVVRGNALLSNQQPQQLSPEGRSPSSLPKLVARPSPAPSLLGISPVPQSISHSSPSSQYQAHIQVPQRMPSSIVNNEPIESVVVGAIPNEGLAQQTSNSRRFYGSPVRPSVGDNILAPAPIPMAPLPDQHIEGVGGSSRELGGSSECLGTNLHGSGSAKSSSGSGLAAVSGANNPNAGGVGLGFGLAAGNGSGNGNNIPSLLHPPNRDPNYLAYEATELARIRAQNLRERSERKEQRMRELRKDNIFSSYGYGAAAASAVALANAYGPGAVGSVASGGSASGLSGGSSHAAAGVGKSDVLGSPATYMPQMQSPGIYQPVSARSPNITTASAAAAIQARRPSHILSPISGQVGATNLGSQSARSPRVSPAQYRSGVGVSQSPQGLLAPLGEQPIARGRPPVMNGAGVSAALGGGGGGRLPALRGGYPPSSGPRSYRRGSGLNVADVSPRR